ncbi:MAG: nucleoside deaminase [Rhodothermia bacterium]|nr:nucleoside deaminase [Rhodothermia bacterium]
MSLEKILEPHRRWMGKALREAEKAADMGEVPVGAVVVQGETIVGRGHNMVETLKDPTAHAEMIAVTAACETLGSKSLEGCTIYVTLEPCPMCAGALIMAKVERLVFGAFDEKAGCASTLYNLVEDRRFNHRLKVISSVEADLAAGLLKKFFLARRDKQRK